MKLQELRNQWEKGREVLLAISNPNRDKVFVLLHSPYNKNDLRIEDSIFEYTKTDNNWTMWVSPNYL